MKKTEINYEFVKKLVFETPNNYNLGEVIRKVIMNAEDNNDGKKTKPTKLPK